MSEQQQYEGDKWTKQTIKILRELGWKQEGTTNFDIPCLFKAQHSSKGKKDRINDHGIDSIFSYYDPYLQKDLNILVESKKRIWSGITKTHIESFLRQLMMTIECADLSEKIQELGVFGVRTGLLMIWCDEVEKYDSNKIEEYLSKIEVPMKAKPITIYVATNQEILRWISLIEYINRMTLEVEDTKFKFFYPSDYYRNSKSMAIQKEHLNLIQMYSSYIFGKSTRPVYAGGAIIKISTNHIFFFAEPTKKELEFVYQLITDFQLEDTDELYFHFYGNQNGAREHIDSFIRDRKEIYKKNESKLEIKYDFLEEYKNVPEKYNVEE